MGWSNYIIVDKLKTLIESNREVGELEDYIKKSIDGMISEESDIDMSTSDLKVSEITIKDLCTMASSYEKASSLTYMNVDKLLLYWLESRDIAYEIKSEFSIDLNKYEKDGYNILRLWENKDKDEFLIGEEVEEDLKEDDNKEE